MTLRLVPLHGKVQGSDAPAATLWINPEHVVTVRPKIKGEAPALDVHIELKLEGVPLFDSWLGQFDSQAAVDIAWTTFLAQLQGAPETV